MRSNFQILPATRETFSRHLASAREDSAQIAESTTADVANVTGIYRVAMDVATGRVVGGYALQLNDDMLVEVRHLWGPGYGSALAESAVENGAQVLDCFDGFLPAFYERFGFREYRRDANWTPGGPDVVFMAHGSLAQELAA